MRDDRAVLACEEVESGLWQLTGKRHGRPSTKTGYVLRDGEDTIFIDPLLPRDPEPVFAALDEIVRGRVRVLITTPFHVRSSELVWRHWCGRTEVTLYGNRRCAARLGDCSAFRPLQGDEELDGGVIVHPVRRPRRLEMFFELPSHRALAVSDRMLEVDGQLRVWPPRHSDEGQGRIWYEQEFLPSLQALTRRPIERVLVTHGQPVLRDGARALAASLTLPPWSRSAD